MLPIVILPRPSENSVADTPGHIQYTRNMVTGASTANLATMLVDARNGVIEQTKRHTFIADLLGIKHVAVCINKMDSVDYNQNHTRKSLINSLILRADWKMSRFNFYSNQCT